MCPRPDSLSRRSSEGSGPPVWRHGSEEHKGAPLVRPDYVSQYVSEKVQQWSKELKLLSSIAITQPHATFAAYIHGLASKWSFLGCTTPLISPQLKVLEDILRTYFIPTLTCRPPPNDVERKLLALPARLGSLGISDPSLNSEDAFKASLQVTAPLRKLIQTQDSEYTYQAHADQLTAKADIHLPSRRPWTWQVREVPPAG